MIFFFFTLFYTDKVKDKVTLNRRGCICIRPTDETLFIVDTAKLINQREGSSSSTQQQLYQAGTHSASELELFSSIDRLPITDRCADSMHRSIDNHGPVSSPVCLCHQVQHVHSL